MPTESQAGGVEWLTRRGGEGARIVRSQRDPGPVEGQGPERHQVMPTESQAGGVEWLTRRGGEGAGIVRGREEMGLLGEIENGTCWV